MAVVLISSLLVFTVLWAVSFVRIFLNGQLSRGKQLLWWLAQIVFLPASLAYLLIVDPNKALKFAAFVTLLLFAVVASDSDSRRVLLVFATMDNISASDKRYVNATSAQFCEECKSQDPKENSECQKDIGIHLQLFEGQYCSDRPITVDEAWLIIAAYCHTLKPSQILPEPRWRVMNAALSYPYRCNKQQGR